ncbi:hypothetical protein [Streptomyces sp. SID14478]|nr:hypothetical protein [Streptomyces sp. SID14478]
MTRVSQGNWRDLPHNHVEEDVMADGSTHAEIEALGIPTIAPA